MINVLYTCDACGIKDAEVEVRDRGKSEDIAAWMRDLTVALGRDHAQKSPFCRATTLTNAKIPLPPGHSRVGDPTAH